MTKPVVVHALPKKQFKDGVIDYQRRLTQQLESQLSDQITVRTATLANLLAGRDCKPQILHIQVPLRAWKWKPFIGVFVALLKLKYRSIRVVCTVHEWEETHWLRKLFQLPIVILADYLITPTGSLTMQLRNWSKLRNAPMSVIPIGANIDFGRSEASETGPIRLGHFGFLYPAKQLTELILVFSAFNRRFKDSELHLVGEFVDKSGREEAELRSLVKQHDVQNSVYWHGYLEPELAQALLAKCHGFVALHKRGFTLRNGSAIACLQYGRPVFVPMPADSEKEEVLSAMASDISQGNLVFLEASLDPERSATIIAVALGENTQSVRTANKIDSLWVQAADRHLEVYAKVLGI